MPLYGFNLGKEASMDLEIYFPGRTVILESMGLVKDFSVEAVTSVKTVIPVNQGGVPVKRRVHEGWKGSFTIARQNAILDNIEQLFQDNFFDGKSEAYAMFTQIIVNPNGTKDKFTYPNSIVMLNNMGDFKQDSEVDQKMSFECPRRFQVIII